MNTNRHAPTFRDYCFTWERVGRELKSQGRDAHRDEIKRLVADEMKKARAKHATGCMAK